MQEFNKISTTSNFIKQLLNTTYLPVIRTVQAGDYLVKGRLYIYKCEIIRCEKSGYIVPYDTSELSPAAKFVHIGEYTFGDRNDKLCKNFQSNQEGYDSVTHEKLGSYLRALRDMYGLNLMPLYNCFSNNPFSQHHIFDNRIIKTAFDYNTKIYKIPIRFNTDYTICIENLGKTTFAPAFIRNETLVKLSKTHIGDDIDATNRYISLHTTDVISTYSGLRFFDPIVIRFDNIPETKMKTYNENINNTNTVEVKLNLTNYFSPIEITTEEDFNFYKQKYLSTTGLYTKTAYNKYVLLNNNSSYKPGIYYICSIDPAQSGWKDSINAESATQDTVYNPSKTYYKDIESFKEKTYTYDIDDIHCEMYDSIEDVLYLLIQVPESFDSNIVVLEGNYKNVQSLKYFNEHELRNYPENYLDRLFIHDIRLMRMNVPQKIPFSDTLIQFLLWNAICGLDSINLDMDRLLQSFRNLYIEVDDKYYANYWYFKYRELISNYAKLNDYEYIDDNLGYVTSEVESLLNRRI